jgi:endonuclease/exonuclease/phosphatase family metal-dependent hydrolase
MRLVAWNCLMGTDRKIPHMLAQLTPDIAVVPESAESPSVTVSTLLGDAVPHAWTGQWPNKGLGILAPAAESLTVLPPDAPTDARNAIAVRAEVSGLDVSVLGVWTVPLGGTGTTPYLRAASAILDAYEHVLDGRECIVAGDFNASAQSSPEDFPRFLDHVRERFGLRSAYHHFHGVEPGEEADMTLWWRRKRDAGYHCDLVLVPEAWTVDAVSVGSFDEWGDGDLLVNSDHAPVIVDLSPS